MKKTDMLQGNIVLKILIFTIPLIIGNIFQLLYNTVDMAIVGQFCGTESMDAIGAATPVFNILSFLIIGLCNGASILMSEFYGSKKYDTLHKEIAVCITAISILSIVLSVLVICLAEPLLIMMNVKDILLEEAVVYLRITTAGLLFCAIFNVYNAALRSMGNSLIPLIFLIVSCISNIALDFIFVLGFNLGVFGVGLSTSISYVISMVTCMIYASFKNKLFRFKISDFNIDWKLLKETSSYAIASALQQIVLHIGKALIQVNINHLTIAEQGGFNVGTKIDDYVLTPAQCIGNSVAVFLAQNRGADQKDRVKKGFLFGMLMELIYTFLIAIVIFFVMKPFIQVFSSDVEVLPYAVSYLTIMVFLYVLPGCTNGVQSYFRGLGKLNIVFLSTLVQIIFRASSSFVFVPNLGVSGAAWSALTGWIAMLTFEVPILIYYLKTEKGLDKHTEVDIRGEKND